MHRLTATDTPMVRYTRTIFPSYASMSSYRTFKQIINIPLYDVDEWILMYKEKMLEI